MDTPGPQAHEEPTHLWPSGKVFRDDHHTPVRNSNVDLMEPGEGTSLLRKISTRCSSTHCDRWLTGPCVSNSTIRLLLDTEHYEDWPLKSAARSVTWFTNLDDIHKVTRESSGSPLRAWQAYHHAILSSFLAEVIAKGWSQEGCFQWDSFHINIQNGSLERGKSNMRANMADVGFLLLSVMLIWAYEHSAMMGQNGCYIQTQSKRNWQWGAHHFWYSPPLCIAGVPKNENDKISASPNLTTFFLFQIFRLL